VSNDELATSLRTEIQTYLKNTVADLQQEIAEMQERVSAEIDRHRGELEKSFQDLLSKGSAAGVDDNFAHVITEHLQMAFEDGSKEAAETVRAEVATPSPEFNTKAADYTTTRDAINDISSQNSQAEILKALVKHASKFVPRGAFFIVKNEHLVGWRVFGSEITGGDEQVREVFLSVNSNTVLGESVRQNLLQHAGQGEYAEDAEFLQKLNFGTPAQMIAIPLVVRARSVAVLYADAGENGSDFHAEALESLVRVAGLTVELLAAVKSSPGKQQSATKAVGKAPATAESQTKEFSFSTPQPTPTFATPSHPAGFDMQSAESAKTNQYEDSYADRNGDSGISGAVTTTEQVVSPSSSFENLSQQNSDYSFPAPMQSPGETDFSFETTMPSYTPAAPSVYEPQSAVQTETQEAVVAAPRRSSERNPELPIDVPEDERRLHNDARRFARLLVSEIKLYNEQKVKEGRQAGDLYSRLRETVERSREMYDKRVSPPVASRFDYFHYELVNTLAEGDEIKLGDNYPGAAV
jgi:hypothetical protein